MNEIDEDIKFTMTSSEISLQFLDTLVYKDGDRLCTYLHVKPTDRNNLVRYNSHHPRAMLKSLPYSQLLRVKRIVEDPNRITLRLDEMCDKFQKRGYPVPLVAGHRRKVETIGRDTLLTQKRVRGNEKRLTFFSTFTNLSKQINNVIKKYTRGCSTNITRNPPRKAYKKARNLKDRLSMQGRYGPREKNDANGI